MKINMGLSMRRAGMKPNWLSGLLVGALLLTGNAWGQESPLVSTLESYLIVEEGGLEQREPADQVEPGDVIEYHLLYSNVSDRELSGLAVIGPIPENTTYVADSNSASVNAAFTVDAGYEEGFQEEPYVRTVIDENGNAQNVVVPPEEYTQLRWEPVGSIAPEETQTYVYRVKVD